MPTKIKKIRIADIVVPDNQRALVPDKLQALTWSIKEIGLKTPITVRLKNDKYYLVAGQHRLRATENLGTEFIDVFVTKGKKIDAKLHQIAENLHRAELTPDQKAEALKLWEKKLELSKAAQSAQPGGKQPHDKGITRTAKGTGMSRDEVRRLRKIASICPDAQAAAKKARLPKTAWLEVAKESGKKAQLKKVAELAHRKKEGGNKLRWGQQREVKRLKQSFDAAQRFKRAWDLASTISRQAFIKTVLRPRPCLDG
jgi:ParB family chromosome partitioning protein